MPPAKCPYLHRCNKYAELTCKLDRKDEVIAAKDREIARLKAENAALKAAQCGGERNPANVRPFGSSTPSSKIPVKANSSEENRRKAGGQPRGHPGHGRQGVPEPDEKIDLPRPTCPVSHLTLVNCSVRTRTVVHTVPARCVTKQYTIYRGWCPACGCYHESEVPGVMPYFAFSNDLIAQVLVDHFGNGIPLGTLARRGYAWGFFTPDISLYRFRGTRGAVVADEVFGTEPHVGVLGVDRYAVYGGSWKGPIQYCLEHYKRNVRDLLEAEPENGEYNKYIPRFLDLLKEAMTLRSRLKGEKYNEESRRIRDDILEWIAQPVKDGRLKSYFEFMDKTRHRFFQWVDHPEIEAENNLAERRIRPLVVARKVCFGSQSEKGLRTRETLMSIIDTLRLRCKDPVGKLSDVFDAISRNRNADVGALLWDKAKP